MRKQDLVKKVADKTGLTESQANTVVSTVFSEIEDALAADAKIKEPKERPGVTISGFGSFKTTYREKREGRNPQTGDAMTIAARNSPTFSPGTQLKRSVNGGDD